MISIRDFAAKMGCSVQNIYKHIKSNQTELEEHIVKRGSKKFLDEYAQKLLEDLITPKAIMINDQELINEINKLRTLLMEANNENTKLHKENANLSKQLSDHTLNQKLLEQNISKLNEDKSNLEEKLNEYKPIIFNIYIKK